MKTLIFKSLFPVFLVFLIACNSGKKVDSENKNIPTTLKEAEEMHEDFKGIGPVKSVTINKYTIDTVLVAEGKKIFDMMCLACHKPAEEHIGPAPKGILDRRTPEWVMNIMLNPTEMVEKDPIAKLLYDAYEQQPPMANQSLTNEQARAILEYFRTL